ncbi:MAG: hypothetical protein ABII74_02320 [Elusimicrobiota bacterium]
MKILQGVLSESREYYLGAKKKIEKMIENLPKATDDCKNVRGS